MNVIDLIRQLVVVRMDFAVEKGADVTPEKLREWVTVAAEQVGSPDSLNIERLIRDIEADYNVHVGSWNALEDDTDHVPWLADRLGEKLSWKFWDRYMRFLRADQRLPPAAVRRTDEVSDDILGRLEDPHRDGPWDRRGLVAGQVQSGKTGNYIGLIAKALDTGYKLVVVLAGVHNSLRSQTQARIDEGILGFDTRAFRLASKANDSSRVGVGRLAGPRLYVNSFTSSADAGDFRLNVAQNMGIAPGGADPIVLVVKKYKSILTNLYTWATELTKERDPETGEFKVRGVPVLVIDDEADHASVNTKSASVSDETDPSVINGLIRQFLNTFDRTAYVAYTATPFANIFIDPDADHSTSGEDLFPRSFIINLPAPSTYTGPEQVFGLKQDTANAIEEVRPLPIVRKVADYGKWLPDKHRASDSLGGELPQTLRDAIVFFLMAGAVRRIRGQRHKHHSMLVHVTRFTNMQKQVAEQVEDYLEEVKQRLAFGEGSNSPLAAQVKRLYNEDLRPTTAELNLAYGLVAPAQIPSFSELWSELYLIASETKIHVVNGTSTDALEYVDHPNGISVIAIGGDKLSRGLTLEGLTVSYYLRASKMYDTLMQMGRWFGYRPGYLDVCRLYTTSGLIGWYERITAASAELQREFEAMAAVGRTPADFGLRVRQHPDGLLVSSPTKLRNAQKLSISFSGSISETVTFRAADRIANFRALDDMIGRLGRVQAGPTGMKVWRHVAPEEVLRFLSTYRADRAAYKVQPKALSDYISGRVVDGELVDWTVVLADVRGGTLCDVGGIAVGLTQRAHHNAATGSGRYTVRRLVSPGHELVDLVKDSDNWKRALKDTLRSWELNPRRKPDDEPPIRPSGLWERRLRSDRSGLLLLYPLLPSMWDDWDEDPTPFVGFAASFPWSARAKPLEYQVNLVHLKNEFGWDDEEFYE
ncbi:endonuclease [Jiangella ureilytica]|uniref:Endonuclease n=1 Tax=Jiangella ureilytica TaxID=2530374 RepID=A0A4V6PB50_9ACTN|nr:Z1 domain-containing protein [Jiangella ureilytica]TDC52005.1 endonuclease [Jiangella ureilytica]